jgi:hypothetical protein
MLNSALALWFPASLHLPTAHNYMSEYLQPLHQEA